MNLEDLLDDLEVLDYYTKDDYAEIDAEVVAISKRGHPVGAAMIREADGSKTWIPKSQMRTDPDGNLYVAWWLVDANGLGDLTKP